MVSLAAVGCGDRASTPGPVSAPTPAPVPALPPAPTVPPAATGDEACAEIVLVAWQGAERAAEAITRSESDARARAEELWQRVEQGADFASVARAESDAKTSAARGGLIGTFARAEWPELHMSIRDAVFQLGVGQWTQVLRAPHGYVIARRCAVEKVHTRHILVRYQGAKNAGAEITRTKEAALARARELRALVAAPGADFTTIARAQSEDSSAERGGDMGNVGRGRFTAAYDEAAFALAPNAISEPVESEFGYHVIQRL